MDNILIFKNIVYKYSINIKKSYINRMLKFKEVNKKIKDFINYKLLI